MNTCFDALDQHVQDGRGGQAAMIYDSPVTGNSRIYTYSELLDDVARFAGVLRGAGTGPGDRVVVYLPTIPEAVITMLARIDAVHSAVFGGYPQVAGSDFARFAATPLADAPASRGRSSRRSRSVTSGAETMSCLHASISR
jgi:acyl-coenzyme A synthetase/AMP-(fatty) acid ligase